MFAVSSAARAARLPAQRMWRVTCATVIAMCCCALGVGGAPPPASATPVVPAAPAAGRAASLVNGSGSSYVGVAMNDWVGKAQTRGIRVNYNSDLGSPAGVEQYNQQQTDFAGTEAEVRSVFNGNADLPRGYQYVPDVAGAVAIMYNVNDRAGNHVTSLHLDQRTISRIFTGDITRWSDPAITATNGGKALPDQPIRIVYRTGRSGTTALFYDFVREAAPDVYEPWRSRLRLPDRRILELPYDASDRFVPNAVGLTTSDAAASFVRSRNGLWSIGYDEFGYAKKYGVAAAWVKDGAGDWVQPFAENIAEGLKDATLRPDLSQELSGVYTSTRPKAYPISAYSYIMTQCAPASDRATCKGRYADGGKESTLADFMRFIACDGQVKMANLGYSPLPPNLSQEVENSVARMTGTRPRKLTASNCSNPTFHGSLGQGAASPPDPFASLPGGVAGTTNGGSGASASANTSARGGANASASASRGGGAAATGATQPGIVGGGSGRQQDVKPVGFAGPDMPGPGALPVVVLFAVLVGPLVIMAASRRLRRSRRRPAPDALGSPPTHASASDT